MFVNKLNQLYKPERILFYMDASDEDIQAFYRGEVSEEIARYQNAFGTYDSPGVFFVDSLDKEVIGIEYRGGASVAGAGSGVECDEAGAGSGAECAEAGADSGAERAEAGAGSGVGTEIDYPVGLKSIALDGAFFYSIEIDNDIEINAHTIRELFSKMAADDDAHRIYSDFSICENPGVIGLFTSEKKLRLLYECHLDSDRSLPVMRGEMDEMSREDLFQLAYKDPITGHFNWTYLLAYIEMPMNAGIQDFAFVHFDIKAFRVINEVYGHSVANVVLRNVVKAMNEADFVYASARCHNDNFAMMIRDMPEEETIATLKKFFDGLSHLEEDSNYSILFRAGVVPMQFAMLYGNRVADAGKLAQSLGTHSERTDIVMYTDQMHEDIQWGNYIKAYLKTAIEKDEFVVYLQPKFDIRKGTDASAGGGSTGGARIKGAEALIRWNYKNKDFLAPYRFVPFFEKDGSIGMIDDIVLDKVCLAFKKWKEEGRPLYPISVNLSRSRLYDKNLVQMLTSVVDKYGVDHELIDFELTESASYDNQKQLLRVLNDLRGQGFRISMDDFGTGYSSLSLLTEMPLDTLKIDKSFVDHIGTEDEREKDLVVIRHIISLAKELNFVCLAEGAEESSQVDRLRELGCEIVQGYFFSKPIPMKEYEEKYLAAHEEKNL